MEAVHRLGATETWNRILAFVQRLRERHPDLRRYRVYHALIGSTVPKDAEMIEEDFKGDDSVELFLESLARGIENE